METIFTGNGVQIIKKMDKYYLIYDAGEINDRMEEIEISKEEAELAQISSMDAYNIIIRHQNKGFG